MARKNPKLTEQLRQAIADADKSRYALSLETGIDQATLSRFMHGKGSLSADGIDLLTEALGLELVARQPKARKTKGR
jgi:transcriptional regulator with XRE-family HTH domain